MEEYWKPDATEKLKNLEEMKNFGLQHSGIYILAIIRKGKGEKRRKKRSVIKHTLKYLYEA